MLYNMYHSLGILLHLLRTVSWEPNYNAFRRWGCTSQSSLWQGDWIPRDRYKPLANRGYWFHWCSDLTTLNSTEVWSMGVRAIGVCAIGVPLRKSDGCSGVTSRWTIPNHRIEMNWKISMHFLLCFVVNFLTSHLNNLFWEIKIQRGWQQKYVEHGLSCGCWLSFTHSRHGSRHAHRCVHAHWSVHTCHGHGHDKLRKVTCSIRATFHGFRFYPSLRSNQNGPR